MEEKKKSKSKYFFRLLFALFIMFICVYAIGQNGFIQRKYSDKSLYTQERQHYHCYLYTEEQIKKFESDVENGKEIDVNAYLVNETVDYSNNSSKLGENISTMITKGAGKLDKLLNSVFSFLFE